MSHVVRSRAVPRPPKKLRAGELHQVHMQLPAELIKLIDQAAADLGREMNPWGPPVTRTEAMKSLLSDGLRKRGLLK